MICPQCKTWVAGTVNFCSRCGTPKAMFLPDGAVAPLPRAPVPPAPPSMTVAPTVQMALGLRPGERAIRMWRAGYVVPGRYYDEDAAFPVCLSGILVASDQRLIFVQEKGLLNKSYQPMDSLELRQITGHRITSLLKMKELEVDLEDQKGRRKQRLSNLYEIDPLTLKPVQPSTPDEARAFFGSLIGGPR